MESTPQTAPTQKKYKLIKVVVIVSGFIALILVVLAVVVMGHKKLAVTADEPVYRNNVFSTEAVIEVTKTGFMPESLTVSPHTRVNFVNKDSVTHVISLNNVAQNDARATDKANDSLLPSDAEIAVGGGVAHVFEKHDTYIYHDRSNPSNNVSITIK